MLEDIPQQFADAVPHRGKRLGVILKVREG